MRVLSFLVLLSACAQSVGDIDRTQPDKLQKSLFEGEWLYQQTVVALPYSTAFTFIGEQGWKTERIRFEIQKNFLIAYRSYDLVAGTDGTSNLPGEHQGRVPVAIFPITSHFDVQRSYNASTGEQTNVLTENSSDRPWYDREWMRVDFAVNLAPNFDFLAGQIDQVPGSHYAQRPDDPDSLLFAQKEDDGWRDHRGPAIGSLESADYFDMVHRVMARPETITFDDGWGSETWPACWLYTNADCAAAEISIRSSFLKVDPASSYVSMDYPDNEILRDDSGQPLRVDYVDQNSLEPDPNGFVVRIPYFDKFGFFRTEREAYDRRRGETHSGKIYKINRFNIWKNTPDCIEEGAEPSHAACEVKPIPFYLSRGFPPDLKPQAEATVAAWNQAFKETVRVLKYADDRPLDEVPDLVTLHENSFSQSDGELIHRGQRPGDLRYNLLAWVDHANMAGLLGYGPATVDPLTGEILQASAFIYGAGVDGYAQDGTDVVALSQDPSRLQEFMEGEDVRRQVQLRRSLDEEARSRTEAFVHRHTATERTQSLRGRGLRALKRDKAETRARLQALRGTPLEERLMTEPIRRAFGGEDMASPADWAMGGRARRERFRRQRLASRNIMHSRFFDGSVAAIAGELEGLPEEEIYQTIRRRVFKAVAEHEMGHNFGLRHNFEGSTDALNYGSVYWGLRGENGRALEPRTEAQLEGGISEHQYSSIMDYGSRFMSDIHGLGLYDQAAIAFGYGGLVSRFEAAPDEPLLAYYVLESALRRFRHYTELPSVFGGTAGMHRRRWVPYHRIIDQMAGRSPWELWEVPFRFCSDEYEGSTSSCAVFDEGADAYEIARSARDLYVEYAPLMSWQRDRRNFSEWGYMNRIWGRTFQPLLSQYQNWVYESFYDEEEWSSLRPEAQELRLQDQSWDQADGGGLPGAAASRLLLETLAEALTIPEPGSYTLDEDENLMVLYAYDADPICPDDEVRDDCSELNIPWGLARTTDSLWDGASGYTFYDRLKMVGSFYDKLLALEMAASSDTAFLGVDTGSSMDSWSIGLNLMFPEETYRLLGAPGVGDYSSFAGRSCSSDRSLYSPWKPGQPDDWQCDGTTTHVDPATGFSVELYAIWYGMAFLPDSFDTTFNDRMKIWLAGSGEAVTVNDRQLLVRFDNPLNNKRYWASRAPDGAYSPGAFLLERAGRLAEAYEEDPSSYNRWRLEDVMTTIEDVRGTHAIYGTFWF